MADRTVKVYRQDLERFLDERYSASGSITKHRFTEVMRIFKKLTGIDPDIISRSPGRVNIVGEHIDYEGYAVLPMAIELDTIVAIGESDAEGVRVWNMDPKFTGQMFPTNPDKLERLKGDASWVNYVMAAYKGVFKHATDKGLQIRPFKGLDILVEGQVPKGSGLSSSAALVCSVALALLGLLTDSAPDKAEVAKFTAECEQFVGTESGGMDQAISIMGERGKAKLVHFTPKIHTEDVPLPQGATFVIANSLAVSEKAVSAHGQYNMRVVECRLASALLGLKVLGLPKEEARKLMKLDQVEDGVRNSEAFGGPNASLEDKLCAALDKDVYTQSDLEALLGPLSIMFEDNPSQWPCIDLAQKSGTGFSLRGRALHVYQEAARVRQFRDICVSGLEAKEKLLQLAQLMDDSHASCRDKYDCSCPALEELVRMSKAAGALGSRLTGAGWGGCTVSLVEQEKVEAFIAKLKQDYYVAGVETGLDFMRDKCSRDKFKRVFEEDGRGGWRPIAGWGSVIFASPPGSGGAILDLRQPRAGSPVSMHVCPISDS